MISCSRIRDALVSFYHTVEEKAVCCWQKTSSIAHSSLDYVKKFFLEFNENHLTEARDSILEKSTFPRPFKYYARVTLSWGTNSINERVTKGIVITQTLLIEETEERIKNLFVDIANQFNDHCKTRKTQFKLSLDLINRVNDTFSYERFEERYLGQNKWTINYSHDSELTKEKIQLRFKNKHNSPLSDADIEKIPLQFIKQKQGISNFTISILQKQQPINHPSREDDAALANLLQNEENQASITDDEAFARLLQNQQ